MHIRQLGLCRSEFLHYEGGRSDWLRLAVSLMARTNSNQQRESQLLAEWFTSLGTAWANKTHVNVGAQKLDYLGQALTPAQQRMFGVWNDWADMRIFTGVNVWLVEAKIVNTGSAYGQLLDYLNEYPSSADYAQFSPAPIVGVVVCAFERPRTAALFAGQGIRTVVYTPSWAGNTLATKVFPAAGANSDVSVVA